VILIQGIQRLTKISTLKHLDNSLNRTIIRWIKRMNQKPDFDSATGLPRPEANRWHERVLMVAVVAVMLLSLIGVVHR